MTKKQLVEAFVLECKQEQEWRERWEANHIEFDSYFKDSGKIEKEKNFVDRYESQHYTYKYGVMLKKPFVIESQDPVVRWYFQNPNDSMYTMASKFDITYREVSHRISNYLKTRTNEKGNKIFA